LRDSCVALLGGLAERTTTLSIGLLGRPFASPFGSALNLVTIRLLEPAKTPGGIPALSLS
jgi:hypothetical protein